MTKTRRVPVHNLAGEVAHYREVEVPEYRVRYAKTEWHTPGNGWPVRAINRRPVRLDGNEIGHIYGVKPSPSNETRPTEFLFIATDGTRIENIDRLENGRADIEKHYGNQGAALAAAKDLDAAKAAASEQIEALPNVLSLQRFPDRDRVLLTLRLTADEFRGLAEAAGITASLAEQFLTGLQSETEGG